MSLSDRFRRLSLWNKLGAIGALGSLVGVLLFFLPDEAAKSSTTSIADSGGSIILVEGNNFSGSITHIRAADVGSQPTLRSQEAGIVTSEDWDSEVLIAGCIVAIVDVATTIGGQVQEADYYEKVGVERATLVRPKEFARPRDFGLPAFDIKLVNNCPSTIFFSEAIAEVSTSTPNTKPVIHVSGANLATSNPKIALRNEGWGVATNAVMSGSISSSDGPTGSRTIQVRIGDVDLLTQIDVLHFLREAGRAEPVPLGADLSVYGAISYSFLDATGARRQDSDTYAFSIVNVEPGVLSRVPPTYAYSIPFESQGTNYRTASKISQALRVGDYDRFTVSVAAAMSSHHLFDLFLAYNQGKSLRIGRFELDYFLPRSAARELGALRSETPEE